MHRFRQLKQRLIKSKRDSQKLQHLQKNEKQIQAWLQKQLGYYGISKESYRLKQLKKDSSYKQLKKSSTNPQSENSIFDKDEKKELEIQRAFYKKDTYDIVQKTKHKILGQNFSKSNFAVDSGIGQDEQKPPQSQKRLVCKKPKNMHLSSMDEIAKMSNRQNASQASNEKSKQMLSHQLKVQHSISNKNQENGQVIEKQLDYYTLILQLTAQLNYSRLNKQSSNQKSILKQIKNLIEYIEGKSAAETSALGSRHSKEKSNHTFSSVYSNESLMNEKLQGMGSTSQKKKIKFKILQQSQEAFPANQSIGQDQNEGNQTFQSISEFEQENEQSAKKSIIDMVNDDNYTKEDILIEQNSFNNQSFMQNSPLSRITEHESQYTQSANPSLNVSPSRNKSPKVFFSRNDLEKSTPLERHLSELYAQDKLKKLYSEKSEKDSHPMLSDNKFCQIQEDDQDKKLIFKKISDKFQSTQDSHHLFQQSLQYKRIMYMLDSQYGYSDCKYRTSSSLLGGKSSPLSHNYLSQNQRNQFTPQTVSDSSAQSFAKEIFESNQQSNHKYFNEDKGNSNRHRNKNNLHVNKNINCLMDDLEHLFRSQRKNQKQFVRNILPELINQEAYYESQRHKRSNTCSDEMKEERFNKTTKYKFNFSAVLSQQTSEQQQNALNFQKYENIRIQSDQDSLYHRVSRNSYLTSSSVQHKNCTASESEQSEFYINAHKVGKLIVKKKQKQPLFLRNQSQKNGKLIVKTKEKINQKQNVLEPLIEDNLAGQIYGQRDLIKKCPPNVLKNSSQQDSFSRSQLKYHDSSVSIGGKPSGKVSQHTSSQNSSNSNKSCQNSNQSKESSQNSNGSKKSIKSLNMKESKISSFSSQQKVLKNSNRQIKYKVYQGLSPIEKNPGMPQKQDKRKVLNDIVSMLNTRYNKNIRLKNSD